MFHISTLHFKNRLPKRQHSLSVFINTSKQLFLLPPNRSVTVNAVPSGKVTFVPNGTVTPLILSTAHIPTRGITPLAVGFPVWQYALQFSVTIIAKTIKGKGVSYMENAVNWHGAAPDDELYEQAMKELNEALAALIKE